jgi:hypothetical protein
VAGGKAHQVGGLACRGSDSHRRGEPAFDCNLILDFTAWAACEPNPPVTTHSRSRATHAT